MDLFTKVFQTLILLKIASLELMWWIGGGCILWPYGCDLEIISNSFTSLRNDVWSLKLVPSCFSRSTEEIIPRFSSGNLLRSAQVFKWSSNIAPLDLHLILDPVCSQPCIIIMFPVSSSLSWEACKNVQRWNQDTFSSSKWKWPNLECYAIISVVHYRCSFAWTLGRWWEDLVAVRRMQKMVNAFNPSSILPKTACQCSDHYDVSPRGIS